jgi:primary-amine oxidase
MIDGLSNSVIETDIVSLPNAPTGSTQNFAGNAFVVQDTVIRKQSEGGREYDLSKERRWRIVNPARKHYSSGKEVGYLIGVKGGVTPMMARSDGWVGTRATFAKKVLWVVKDKEEEKGGRMWPAGKYVPQTRTEPEDSLWGWMKEEENLENDDIVVFITVGQCLLIQGVMILIVSVGTTHIPRPEDWPVYVLSRDTWSAIADVPTMTVCLWNTSMCCSNRSIFLEQIPVSMFLQSKTRRVWVLSLGIRLHRTETAAQSDFGVLH